MLIAVVAVVAVATTALNGAVAVQAAPADDAAGLGASLSASGRWYGAISMSSVDGAYGWSNNNKYRSLQAFAEGMCKGPPVARVPAASSPGCAMAVWAS
jgi:hypothetical protein